MFEEMNGKLGGHREEQLRWEKKKKKTFGVSYPAEQAIWNTAPSFSQVAWAIWWIDLGSTFLEHLSLVLQSYLTVASDDNFIDDLLARVVSAQEAPTSS